MNATIKLIVSSVDFVADFLLAILEINSRVMESLVKSIIYVYQQLFCFALTIVNGIHFALSDLIIFLLEFGHGVLVILDTIINCILYVLHITSQAFEIFFSVTFALYSLTSSITKSLLKQIILLAETLQNAVVFIVSSCALFLQSVPVFATMLFKSSLALIAQAVRSVINNVFCGARYIHDSFHCFASKAYASICDLSTDFYIGSFLLFLVYFLFKKIWQTYQRNGPPQYILLLPHVFMNMIHDVAIKFHLCSQWIFSLFSYTQITEGNAGVLLDVDSVAEYINASDTTLNHLEEVNASTSSYQYLQRKPLISLRNEVTDEEKCELSARTLKVELERERDRHLCIACQDKPKSVIILPCRHLCLCSTCYRNIIVSTNVCPLCRHEIYDSLHVFF